MSIATRKLVRATFRLLSGGVAADGGRGASAMLEGRGMLADLSGVIQWWSLPRRATSRPSGRSRFAPMDVSGRATAGNMGEKLANR
jgi:hypothetical protein